MLFFLLFTASIQSRQPGPTLVPRVFNHCSKANITVIDLSINYSDKIHLGRLAGPRTAAFHLITPVQAKCLLVRGRTNLVLFSYSRGQQDTQVGHLDIRTQ